jgi:aminopeptidase N
MLRFISALFLLFSVLLLTGCKYTPYLKYYTARKGHYPRFFRHDRLTGSKNHFRACYDVTHYALDVKPNIEEQRLSATMKISFSALTDFDTLLLDLHPCYKIKSLTAASGTPRYYRRRNALFVVFKTRQRKGAANAISISYEGKPITLAGFCPVVWNTDRNGAPWFATICEGIGAHTLWPCKDLLYDEADSSSVCITVPKGLTAVSNGVLQKTEDRGNETAFFWKASNAINVYNLSFAVGNFTKVTKIYENASGSHELIFYLLAHRAADGEKHFEQIKDMFAFLENTFGEYPWYNDGYKLVQTPGGASMEHQTSIHYSGIFRNNGMGVDALLLHETAHEWFGNSITASDYGDLWLHESFATYAEWLYTEHKSKPEHYTGFVNYHLANANGKVIYNKVPIAKKTGVRYMALVAERDQDIYNKGAAMLHSLRWTFQNDSLFFGMVKAYYAKHKKSQITTADFIAHVNQFTGKNYGWFFEQYLFDYRAPEFNYYVTRIGGKQMLHYRWKNTVAGFDKMPVRVMCGNETRLVYPTEEKKIVVLCGDGNVSLYGAGGYCEMRKLNRRY